MTMIHGTFRSASRRGAFALLVATAALACVWLVKWNVAQAEEQSGCLCRASVESDQNAGDEGDKGDSARRQSATKSDALRVNPKFTLTCYDPVNQGGGNYTVSGSITLTQGNEDHVYVTWHLWDVHGTYVHPPYPKNDPASPYHLVKNTHPTAALTPAPISTDGLDAPLTHWISCSGDDDDHFCSKTIGGRPPTTDTRTDEEYTLTLSDTKPVGGNVWKTNATLKSATGAKLVYLFYNVYYTGADDKAHAAFPNSEYAGPYKIEKDEPRVVPMRIPLFDAESLLYPAKLVVYASSMNSKITYKNKTSRLQRDVLKF